MPMMTKKEEGFLALGSNLGDRKTYLRRAILLIDDLPGVSVMKLSHIYETTPVGGEGSFYLNMTLEFESTLAPTILMEQLLEIESFLGRRRSERTNEARVIDIDMLLYGDKIIDNSILTLPHPRMHKREFVLAPLSELAPMARHPISGKTIQELLAEAERTGVIKRGPINISL